MTDRGFYSRYFRERKMPGGEGKTPPKTAFSLVRTYISALNKSSVTCVVATNTY